MLAGILTACPVLPAVADTADFTISDNGVYQMDKALTEAPLTLEAEIKFPTTGASRTGVLLGNWCYPVGAFADYDVNASGNPRLYWGTSGSNNETLTFTDVNVFTGEWLHLAIVIDVANTQVHCYVNGELKQSLTTKYTEAIVCSNAFAIGNNIRQGNGYNFRGAIKSLALYNDVRTADEVAADVSAYGTDGLMTHYDMEGLTEGDTLTDTVSGNNAVWEQKWLDSKDPVGDYDYAIAVLGDPQTVTRNYPTSLPKIYQYIADTAEEKKVAHVFTMGDLVDTTAGVEKEWVAITDAMDLLNGVVPHSMLRGNHDNETFYDRYITEERYNDGVVTMDGTMKNYYREIEMGGVDYLTVTLDWRPSVAEQQWACEVIEAHPDHRVILTTHSFTDSTGNINNSSTEGDGVDIWNRIASKYSNIVLVLSGHSASEDIVMRKAVGDNGNTVTHILVDQQDADQPIAGGTGLIAYFYFSDNGKHVEVEFYSPLRDQYYKPCNQFSFELDIPWDEEIPALKAATAGREAETGYTFTPAGLAEYANGKYTATVTDSSTGTNYYFFGADETKAVDTLNSKFHFYYEREGTSIYGQRDMFVNNDSDGETRWVLMWDQFLQRHVTKSGGSQIFRKIDSLVPLNSLGQEITATDFKTTFHARLEDETKGAVILGFRQQQPGKYTTGYYKMFTGTGIVAIGRSGITIAAGSDIVGKNGDAAVDMYNHFQTDTFDDPDTADVTEMLPKNITVTVEARGTLCSVYIYDTDNGGAELYRYENIEIPYTTPGTLAYSVSDIKNSIGAISLEVYDQDGNAADLSMPADAADASLLRFYGGDIAVDATATDNGYRYILTAKPVDGYGLDESALLVVTENGQITPTRLSDNRYYVETAGGGTVYASFMKESALPDEAVRFEADFSALAALVPTESFADGAYTSTADDTAINAWVSEKFGLFYSQEYSVYHEMAHLGQSSNELYNETNYTKAMQWQIRQSGAIGMTVAGKSGQLMRKQLALTAKNPNGEYAVLSDFEAEVVFNKAGKNAKVGGVFVSFHEKYPGRVNFDNGITPTSSTGNLMIVSNALATYSYEGYGDKIAVYAGVDDVENCRSAELVTDKAWETSTDYKLYMKVVGTTLTWSVTNLSSGATVAFGTDEIAAGSGTVSVGVASGEHELKSFTVTELDENGNAVDFGAADFDWTVQNIIPFADSKYVTGGNYYYTFGLNDTDDAATIRAALDKNFGLYYNSEGTYTAIAAGANTHTSGQTADQAGFCAVYANRWLQRTVGSSGGTQNFRLISSLVPKDVYGNEMQVRNFETSFEIRFETTDEHVHTAILGFRQREPGKFVNGYWNINKEQAFVAISRQGITIAGGEDIVSNMEKDPDTGADLNRSGEGDMYNQDAIKFSDTTNAAVKTAVDALPQDTAVYVKVVEDQVTVKVMSLDKTTVYFDNSDDPAACSYDTAGYIAYGIAGSNTMSYGNIHLTRLADVNKEQPYNSAVVDEQAKLVTVKTGEGYELKAGSLTVTDAVGSVFTPTRVGFQSDNGQSTQYALPANAVAPFTVNAEFYQPTGEQPNTGWIGTSTYVTEDPAETALRFVHRLHLKEDNGTRKINIDGTYFAVKDYGILLAAQSTLQDPEALNVEIAEKNRYIQQYSFVNAEDFEQAQAVDRFYDICGEYVDIAVQIEGISTEKLQQTNMITRIYVQLADGSVIYGDAAVRSFADAVA